MSLFEMERINLWIDTDCGIDDSTAILICLDSPRINVVGISCIGGNVSVSNVSINVLRTLKAYSHHLNKINNQLKQNKINEYENIPVYAGCEKALLTPSMHVPHIHGNDGLGDIDPSEFDVQETVEKRPENGVFKMIETIRKYEHITVMTLGPLTNFALANHLAPDISEHIDSLVIMGGAEDLKGNTTKFAEFNIRCDPEAAKIVFDTFPNHKITLSTWSLTMKNGISGENFNFIFKQNGPDCTIMQRWIAKTWEKALKHDNGVALMADPLAAFIVAYGDDAILESMRKKIDVPLFGEEVGATKCNDDANGVRIVTKINFDLLMSVMKHLLTGQ
ncbi:Inosine-uridine preferring nucleoside hydrolase family protein [Tritrichomonas foetus]|uniref:Inosine-uridine preferring nucleoside hydrolase family protein n=1 Tax=Tritrichomonas foetus TaxID=1144522 RepID=A0A1J4KK52_9EUKA|nr:Inosine-uridine preferring nucleoside hydrolase family protein [Tritrichomonas foetus]|eukprot:OHT11328.1 Inosine-uridine preferring nucleoside hydrolase family protein [Tritrichomonas foetus]